MALTKSWAGSDQVAAFIVEVVMSDGVARTDEEIEHALHDVFDPISPDRARHGRKVLSDEGRLIQLGRKRTSRGGLARIWVLKEDLCAAA